VLLQDLFLLENGLLDLQFPVQVEVEVVVGVEVSVVVEEVFQIVVLREIVDLVPILHHVVVVGNVIEGVEDTLRVDLIGDIEVLVGKDLLLQKLYM